MMKKKLLATTLCFAMTATALAGCGGSSNEESKPAGTEPTKEADAATTEKEENTDSAKDETSKEPVELTLWVTSRNEDDWSTSMEEQFLEEHPWITLNKVVKEGDPGNEFHHDGFLY